MKKYKNFSKVCLGIIFVFMLLTDIFIAIENMWLIGIAFLGVVLSGSALVFLSKR